MSNKVSYTFIAQDLYTKVARKVSRATVGLQKQFKKLENVTRKSLTAIRNKVNSTGKDLLRFGKIALAATAALTIKFGAGFQDAMADVSAITGAAGKDLQFFSDESLRLAKASVTAQSEVATAFKIIASAKSELLKDPKGLSRVTEQVLLLKNAAGLELAQAAKVTTEALNQFGAGADQAARFVNVLAAGSKVGASEVGATGAAIVESAVFAKQAGLSFEELNSTIQVLAKNGVPATKAGTALKNMFVRLESTGDKKLMPSIIGINQVLENLSQMNLSTKDSTKLFGLEAAAAGDILIKNRALVAKWTKELTGTQSATEQAERRMATFSTKARKLGIIIKGILIRVFLKLEPVLTKMADSMSKFFDSITDEDIDKFIEKLQDTVRVIRGIGAAIKEVFKTIGKFIGESTAKVAVFNEKLKTVTGAGLIGTAASAPARALPGIGSGVVGVFRKVFESLTAPNVTPAPLGEKIDVGGTKTQTDINVNVRAPEGAVESVKARTRGGGKNLNVGLNMVPAT